MNGNCGDICLSNFLTVMFAKEDQRKSKPFSDFWMVQLKTFLLLLRLYIITSFSPFFSTVSFFQLICLYESFPIPTYLHLHISSIAYLFSVFQSVLAFHTFWPLYLSRLQLNPVILSFFQLDLYHDEFLILNALVPPVIFWHMASGKNWENIGKLLIISINAHIHHFKIFFSFTLLLLISSVNYLNSGILQPSYRMFCDLWFSKRLLKYGIIFDAPQLCLN